MIDPFKIEGPACISFSGGRTSAFMLRRILDAHGGSLPADVHVLFANTGKERPETLDFVQVCAMRWDVRVRWIEYEALRGFVDFCGVDAGGRALFGPRLVHSFREVTYETASRRGEPFEALIRSRSFLPNAVMRICTQELKIRPMKGFARLVAGFDYWTSVVGLRADEPRRVAKATAPAPERWEIEAPLAAAGVTLADVHAFWSRQPFDLQLRSHEGNCDLCFLKGRQRIERIMRDTPELAAWWIAQEDASPGADRRFRHDRPSYLAILRDVERRPFLPGLGLDDVPRLRRIRDAAGALEDEDEDEGGALPCACTD